MRILTILTYLLVTISVHAQRPAENERCIEVESSWIPALNVSRGVKVPFMSDHNPVIVKLRMNK